MRASAVRVTLREMRSRLFALTAILCATLTSSARADTNNLQCPAETFWDGAACAHARATCGGWDGVSCLPLDATTPNLLADATPFELVSQRAQSVCQYDTTNEARYTGGPSHIQESAQKDINQARWIDDDFQQVRRSATPSLVVATFVRAGEMYDCIWTHMREAHVQVPPPLTAAELAKFPLRYQTWIRKLQLKPLDEQAVRRIWKELCDYFFVDLERRLIVAYVSATVLARRYGLNGFDLTSAHDRIPVVAAILGEPRMRELVATMRDPTDPEPDETRRRYLTYGPGILPR